MLMLVVDDDGPGGGLLLSGAGALPPDDLFSWAMTAGSSTSPTPLFSSKTSWCGRWSYWIVAAWVAIHFVCSRSRSRLRRWVTGGGTGRCPFGTDTTLLMMIQFVCHLHRNGVRQSLLQWVRRVVVDGFCGCGIDAEGPCRCGPARWKAALLVWLDEWCCLVPLDCSDDDDRDGTKKKKKKKHAPHDEQEQEEDKKDCDTMFLPRFCCPKRRARWEKNWRKKCSRHEKKKKCSFLCKNNNNNNNDLCFLSKLFCLPPPLPLQDETTSRSVPAAAKEATTEDSLIPEEDDDDTVPDSIEETPPSSSRTLDSDSDVDPILVLQRDEIALPQPQPIQPLQVSVHLIDQVRMQQWSTLLAQPKWRRRQVKYRDTDGLSPLHWAAAGGAPLPVIDRLLTAAGSIAQQADDEGSLPLHFATHYAAHRDVIAAVWQAYPAAICHRDRYGRTPLYHAVDKSLGLATLQLLVQEGGGSTVTDAAVTVEPTSTAGTTATITDHSHTNPHYELITTPCYSPQGSSRREQATRTPLFMVWASVLNDREARIKLRGKKWEKAVWMLQNSYRYHHGMVTTTGKKATTGGGEEDEDLSSSSSSSSLVSICIRMDLYLPDPVVPLVATAQGTTPGRLSDLVVAAATPSYSLERILELLDLLLSRLIVVQKDDGVDVRGVAAVAAAHAGQPWQVLERLPHRDRHALAIMAAMARPIYYDRTTTTSLHHGGFLQDPLGLLRRVQTPKDSEPPEPGILYPTVVTPADGAAAATAAVDTIYRLLRENPNQLLGTAAASTTTTSVSA